MLRYADDLTALVDARSGRTWSHADLHRAADDFAKWLPPDRSLVFLLASSRPETVVAFYACLEQGHPVALLDPSGRPAAAARLIDLYRPDAVVGEVAEGLLGDDYRHIETGVAHRTSRSGRGLHPDLAVLLTTSGSTGSAKFVRLSRRNIESNADAIISSLGLTRSDSAMTSLPLHYSYGMSLMTSHILAGGTLVTTEASVLEPDFWDEFRNHSVTYFAGVPYTYQMLRRIGWEPSSMPSLRALTQAGGKLDAELVLAFHSWIARRGGEFFVMYGQTEAAPRIACLPSTELPDRIGSAGRPLPGGRLEAVDPDGIPLGPGAIGEIAYEGPNVMMGYADGPEDLALPDTTGGRLLTGDLGYLDADGFLFLTGRLKRIAKVFGNRISLDEVESALRSHGPVAVVARRPDALTVVCAWGDDREHDTARRRLASDLRLPLPAVRFERVESLPLLPSGKIDYARLTEAAGATS